MHENCYDVCAYMLLAECMHCYCRQLLVCHQKGNMVVFPSERCTKLLHYFHKEEPG